LQQDGFVVIEFTTADVMADPGYVIGTIEREFAARPVLHPPR
jgi:very-short-patch-repair endonuclease